MPSRVKLKLEILRLERENKQLDKELQRAYGAERAYRQQMQQKDKEYTVLMTQWTKFQKEYTDLANQWNAYQGAVHRPTDADLIRMRARGEMVQAVAQMLIRALFSTENRPYDPRTGM